MDDFGWIKDVIPTKHMIGDRVPIEGKRFIIPNGVDIFGIGYEKWRNIKGWGGKYKINGMGEYMGEYCYTISLNNDDLSNVYFPVSEIDKDYERKRN
jgi:hypothetical protein